MTVGFASGRIAHAFCERCGQRYKLKELRRLTINEKLVSEKVCPTCWEPDHPQYRIGKVDKNDPQALRDPRPDIALDASRALTTNNLTTNSGGNTFADGQPYF